MTRVCDSLVKNIYKNHNIPNSINIIPNSINNIPNNSINYISNKVPEIINNNAIAEVNNSSNENEINYSSDNNNENLYENNDDVYEHIKIAKDLEKLFFIGRATGDGNCLFYALSTTHLDVMVILVKLEMLYVIIWKIMILKI